MHYVVVSKLCLPKQSLQGNGTHEQLPIQAIEEERSQAGAGLSLTLEDLESGPAEPAGSQADGRIILDDIDWDLVSEQHGTRTAAQCLTKWYTQLAPSMVTKGKSLKHCKLLMLDVMQTV